VARRAQNTPKQIFALAARANFSTLSEQMHWLARRRLWILAAICAFWTTLILLGHFFSEAPFLSVPWRSEQGFEDLLRREGRKTPTRDDFVFVGIDQSTLQMPQLLPEELAENRAFQLMTERPFPWSREVWAILLDKLFASGARLVIFDMVFNNSKDGDVAFHDALQKYRDRVIIGANIDTTNNNQIVVPNQMLIAPPATADDRVGYVNFWPDAIDGKIRATNFTTSERQLAGQAPFAGEEVFTSFSARALEKLGRGNDVLRDQRGHMFRFSANDAYPPRALYEVFDPKFWHANYHDGAFFNDKVVMIGAASQVEHDVVDTPMSPSTLGPALHLQSIAAALGHEFLRPTTPRAMYAFVIAAGALAWTLIAFVRRPLVCLLALVGVAACYLLASRVAFDRAGYMLLTVPVLCAFVVSGLSSLGFEYMLERIEKVRTRRTLERYVSKNLVQEILENPASFYNTLKGVRKPATILFSDIVGFTTLTEKADPEKLVTQLNEYLTRMVAVVFENEGTLDKFIGDAVMAVWGMTRSVGVENDAKMAARAALGMRRELGILNKRWMEQGSVPLGIGVGINQGEVLAGNIGSSERADLTVIGDSVNLASRLEALTRTYGVDILVGPTATEMIRDEFYVRSVARVQVKGKTKPVEISTLLGVRGEPFDDEFARWLESYEEGLRKFRARDFTEAKILFSRFLEFYPDDQLAKLYLQRALEYEVQPPDEAWSGVEVFTKK
jgi:adenylate cyclase